MKNLYVRCSNNEIHSEVCRFRTITTVANSLTIKTVFSGSETITLGRRIINLYPGNFLVINSGSSYTTRIDSETPVHSLSLIFDQQYFKSASAIEDLPVEIPFTLFGSGNFFEGLYPLKDDLRINLTHLTNCLVEKTPNKHLLEHYLHHTFLTYLMLYTREVVNREICLPFSSDLSKKETIKKALYAKDYILSNYSAAITLEDISDHCCISVNHLLRIFKAVYKESPYQFLTRSRLKRACYLLKNTDLDIKSIVEQVGFACPSSFIRLFKMYVDVTPAKFRNIA